MIHRCGYSRAGSGSGGPGRSPCRSTCGGRLVGRDAKRTGQHLTAVVVASLGMFVVASTMAALRMYPEYAQRYEVSVLSATTLAAGTQAYRNDGLLVSCVLVAMLFSVFLFPDHGLGSPYPRYLDFVGDVAVFGGLLGTTGFVPGASRARRRRSETRSTDSGVKKLQSNSNRGKKTRCARLPGFKSAMAFAARFTREEGPRRSLRSPLGTLEVSLCSTSSSQGPDLNRRRAALQAAA